MTEPTEGFITLHRKIREHPYWQDPERLRAWVDILFMAAWKRHRRLIGTDQVVIGRGEFVGSERFLADRWRWSRGRTRRFIEGAKEAGELEVAGETSDGTIYRVVKYEDYQNPRPSDGTTSGPPPEHEKSGLLQTWSENEPRGGTRSGTSETVGAQGSPPHNRPSDGTRDGTIDGPPADHQRYQQPAQIEVREQGKQENNQDEEASRYTREAAGPAAEPQPPADARAEMEKLTDTAAENPPDDVDPDRIRGELSMIVSGDDVTAWQDETGNRVPWEDRPRLLRLALKTWWLDREQYPKIRSALRYVVLQQYSPLQPRLEGQAAEFANGRDVEHYDSQHTNGVKRGTSSPVPAGSSKAPEPEGGDEAQKWAATHPDSFQEIQDRMFKENALDPQNSLERMQAFGLALKHIREEILT